MLMQLHMCDSGQRTCDLCQCTTPKGRVGKVPLSAAYAGG